MTLRLIPSRALIAIVAGGLVVATAALIAGVSVDNVALIALAAAVALAAATTVDVVSTRQA